MRQPEGLGGFVRRHDPDRYLTALFAPADRRETLFVLYAFNHELARAWEVASQPTLALIRLQWWRETVEGASRRHEVADPLARELAAGRLDAADLLALIEGRELVEQGLATLGHWQAYLEASAGALAVVAGRALGAAGEAAARLRALGTGYGVAGQLRSAAVWGGQIAARPAAELRSSLVEWGSARLGPPEPMPRAVLAAGLAGVLGRRDLGHPGRPGPRRLGDRLAVTMAALRGRV